jgi:pimeloyl-ACP methyl ester carboxylesterase
MKTTITLSVFLFSIAARPGVCAEAVFDKPGLSVSRTLEILRSGASAPPPAAGPLEERLTPIVLTISGVHPGEIGVGVEFRHLVALWNWVFPGEAPDTEKIRAEQEEMRIELEQVGSEGDLGDPGRNYIDEFVRRVAAERRLRLEVEGFTWTRDPGDSRVTLSRLLETLEGIRARGAGRPVHIIAHSWGSVLSHSALIELERAGKPFPVARFVTMGSPLVPLNLFERIFGSWPSVERALQARVRRPAGVARWVNLYAANDPFAGRVAAADENARIDERVEGYERRLDGALAGGGDPAVIRLDRRRLKSGYGWHAAYFGRFKAGLTSLGETVDWPIASEQLPRILPPGARAR